MCPVGHPLIHLGYAFELSSRDVAMEALAMTTSVYGPLHKYLDDPKYTRPSPLKDSSPLELLQRLSTDQRLDSVFTEADPFNTDLVLKDHEAILLEYWNALQISNPTKQFEESQIAATALVVATHDPKGDNRYDFFLVHVLTTSHAMRILLPISRYSGSGGSWPCSPTYRSFDLRSTWIASQTLTCKVGIGAGLVSKHSKENMR